MIPRHRSRKLAIRLLMTASALALAAFIAASPAPVQAADAGDDLKKMPIDRGVGQVISTSFKLTGLDGKEFNLRKFALAGHPAVVLVFTGVDCPVGNLYMPTLVKLAKEYEDKRVLFIAINSNQSETLDDVRKHAKEYGLDKAGSNLIVAKDVNGDAAELALAERTNEALVINARLDIRAIDKLGLISYRGAIDDQYHYSARKPAPTKNHLRQALDQHLASQTIEPKATEVVGCPIERGKPRVMAVEGTPVRAPSADIQAAYEAKAKASAPEAAVKVGDVAYSSHVATILAEKCQTCHRPGQSGPFPLLTYEDAKRRSKGIREAVEDRRMPPWHADPRHGEFSNDRSLTPAERAILMAWVDQGAPRGDLSHTPAPKTHAEGWTIGEPDAVIEMPRTHLVPAGGAVDYVRYFVTPPFQEEKWVQAAEARPGDRTVVHHIIVYFIPPGERIPRFLVGYAPGDLSLNFPPGLAKRVPANSQFFFEMHYTPNGKVREDRSSVGLIFAKEAPKREVITRPIESQAFIRKQIKIPANHDNFPIASAMEFKGGDIELLGMMPHMHLRGKDFLYQLTEADGETRTLLSVPAYDFGWQNFYWLKEPLKLKAGSRIDCLAHFDNSEQNLYNPDPKNEVAWGDQTFEEMMIGFIEISIPIDNSKPLSFGSLGRPVEPKLGPKLEPRPQTSNNGGAAARSLLRSLLGGGNSNANANATAKPEAKPESSGDKPK